MNYVMCYSTPENATSYMYIVSTVAEVIAICCKLYNLIMSNNFLV